MYVYVSKYDSCRKCRDIVTGIGPKIVFLIPQDEFINRDSKGRRDGGRGVNKAVN